MNPNGRAAVVFFPRLLLQAAIVSAVCLFPAAQSLRFDGTLDVLMPAPEVSRSVGRAEPPVITRDVGKARAGDALTPPTARVAQQLRADVVTLSAVSWTIALVAAALSLRSLVGVLLASLSVGVGFLWAVAAIAVTGRPITLATASVIPLLPLIGIAFPLYFLAQVQQQDAGGDAAGKVLARLRVPLGMLAASSLLGALVQVTSDFPALRDFGLFAGLGIVCMGAAALVVAPAGVATWLRPKGPAVSEAAALLHSRRIERLGAAAVRHRWTLAAIGCALVVVAVVGLGRVENAADFQSLLGTDTTRAGASSRDLRTWDVRIGSHGDHAIDRLDTLLAIADLQRFIADQNGVVSTHSLVDFIAAVPDGKDSYALPATQQEIDSILRSEHDEVARFVSDDFSSARIQVHTRALDSGSFNILRDRIEAFARGGGWLGGQDQFPPGVTVSAEGRLVELHRRVPRLNAETLRGLAVVSLLLLGFASVHFLSSRIGVWVIALNLLAMIVVVGMSAWFGVGANAVTAPLPSLLLGLAVGHTAYYFRALGADGRTLDCPTEALTRIVQSTGRPLTYALGALIVGIAAMALAEVPALHAFGVRGALGLGLAFVANLLLLSSRVLNARIITMADFLSTRLGPVEEIPLFEGMHPAQAKLVVLSGKVATAEPGESMARQGDHASELYLVLSGRAVVRRGADGPVIDSMQRGDVVGEMGLVRKVPRSADVVATEAVEYLVLDGGFLERLRRQYPRTAAVLLLNLARILSDRLDRASKRITALEGDS